MNTEVTVVVPSIKSEVRTLESIPEDAPVIVEREGSLNEARNRGVGLAETDVVVIMDDDIAFSEDLFWALVDEVDDRTFVGVADWEFGLVAGRVMAFHKDVWRTVGGFDERLGSHNADTDFSIRIHDAGYEIVRFPRELFDHEEHERSITTWDRAWRFGYLCVKHPRYAPLLLTSIIRYNLQVHSNLDEELLIPKIQLQQEEN